MPDAIMNAKTARSQLIGGIVYGLGMALLEETHVDGETGRIVNANIADYLVPVNADVPDIQTIIVANDELTSNPLGAKGIGELPMVGVAAAVANAVYHATGVRVRKVPIRIEDLLGVAEPPGSEQRCPCAAVIASEAKQSPSRCLTAMEIARMALGRCARMEKPGSLSSSWPGLSLPSVVATHARPTVELVDHPVSLAHDGRMAWSARHDG